MLGRGTLGHVVVESDFVEPQVRGGSPAHVLHIDLLDAVDPQGLAAVVLARGVQLDVEYDLLPLPAHERDLRGGLMEAIPVAATHVWPIGVKMEGLQRHIAVNEFGINTGIEVVGAVRNDVVIIPYVFVGVKSTCRECVPDFSTAGSVAML